MNPIVRKCIIQTSIEIIKDRGEKLSADKIKIEFDKLVDGLNIPREVRTSTNIVGSETIIIIEE